MGLVWERGGADVLEPCWLSKERRWQRSGNHVRNGLGCLWSGPVQTVLSEDGSVHRVKGRTGVEIK